MRNQIPSKVPWSYRTVVVATTKERGQPFLVLNMTREARLTLAHPNHAQTSDYLLVGHDGRGNVSKRTLQLFHPKLCLR